jgi:hypothetical protein
LSVEDFNQKAAAKEIRHVGLAESVSMIARTLGWKLDKVEEMIEPVVAKDLVRTEFFKVQPGRVTGVHQIGVGIKGGERLIELDLQMSVDAARIWTNVNKWNPGITRCSSFGVFRQRRCPSPSSGCSCRTVC